MSKVRTIAKVEFSEDGSSMGTKVILDDGSILSGVTLVALEAKVDAEITYKIEGITMPHGDPS